MRRLLRFLKLAEQLNENNDSYGLQTLCTQFDAFVKKHHKKAHYMPHNDGKTPNPWRRNMDYAGWENSPYFGSVSEFMEKFPGGIRDWVEWRRKTQEERNKKWSEFVWEKKATVRVKKIADKKRKAIYSGVFLTSESKAALANWWQENLGDLLPKHFMHHMTIKFKPSPEDIVSLPLGEDTKLQIIGTGSDEKGQAVAVNAEISVDNPIPHITVATDGTSPVYSNELLSAEISPIGSKAPTLVGKVGFFDGKDIRYDLVGTIYEDINQEQVPPIEQEQNKISEAHFIDTKEDSTKDFPKEPHLWSGEGPASFRSVLEFIKKHRSQDAKDSDAGAKAVTDFINYWKLLKKIKRKKGK